MYSSALSLTSTQMKWMDKDTSQPLFLPDERFLTPEDGNDRLSRNVCNKLTTTRCVIKQKSGILPYISAEA